MQNLTITGNIGKDAVLNKQQNGDTAINFSLAANRKFKDKAGVQHEETTWYDCALWKRADQSTEIAQYLKAGTKLLVVGRPGVRVYTPSGGQPTAVITVNVQDVELLGSKPQAAGQPAPPTKPAAGAAGDDDNDLPF